MKSTFGGLAVVLLAGAVLGVVLATRQKFSGDSNQFLNDLQDTLATGFERIRQQYGEPRDAALPPGR